MKEVNFIKKNISFWENIEKYNEGHLDLSPDELKNSYIHLIDDLSYSRTFYPNSQTTMYLNQLSLKIHSKIYKKKHFNFDSVIKFWKIELPAILYKSRKELFIAFSIFLVSMMIGVLSGKFDDSFIRLILGDEYVNMTLRNIDKGDPLAVYKQANQMDMFLGITINNMLVSFNAFAFGLLTSFGTGFILFKNGVMLGAFQQFFSDKGLFYDYIRVVWIHGTLEISAIIIAGAAGIVLGNSFLYPGTYTRLESFKQGAERGIKIIIGTMPMFLVAGFLEGFVTRLTDMPHIFNFFIIIMSLAFVIWYYVIYPFKFNNRSLYAER